MENINLLANTIGYFDNVNYFYTIVGIVSLITILLVSNRVRSTKYKEIVDKPFIRLLNFFMLFCFVDASWGVFAYLSHPELHIFSSIPFLKYVFVFLSYMFHGFAALSAFMWSGYIVCYLQPTSKGKKIITICRITLFVFQIICLFINLISIEYLRAFFFDEQGVYQSSHFRNFLFYLQFCHYIMIIVYSILLLFKENNQTFKQRAIYAIVYSSVPFVMGIGQMIAPDLAFYSLGFMLSSTVIYIFNITTQRETFLNEKYDSEKAKHDAILKSVSSDYDALFVINLFSNKYDVIANSVFFKEKIYPYLVLGEDFFADRSLDLKNIIYADDYQMVSEKITKKNILSQFELTPSFCVNFRIFIDDKIRYYMMKCVYASTRSNDQRLVIGFYDVDTQVRESMKLYEELETVKKSNKQTMKESDSFAFHLSRDYKLCLNMINAYLNIIQKNLTDNEMLLYFSKIKKSTDFLERVNDDFIEVSKLESSTLSLELDSVSIGFWIESFVPAIIRLSNDKKINFSYEIKNIKDDNVICDYKRVNQILEKILFNAIRFTKNLGTINFSVEQLEENNQNVYKFSVSDNGEGISYDFLPMVYNNFSREKSENLLEITDQNLGCGCGLGLSIAKKLVDLMNGRIEITSEKYKGTTVDIYLPLKKSDKEDEITTSQQENIKAKLIGKRVLFVDDVPFYIEIISEVLKGHGLLVESVNDGFTAIDNIKNHPADYYDFILMDIKMKNIDGYKTSEIINSLPNLSSHHIPIIALSASELEQDRMRKAGIDKFVSKTDDFSSMLSALTELNK